MELKIEQQCKSKKSRRKIRKTRTENNEFGKNKEE